MDTERKTSEFYVCSRCGLELPRESFSWRNSGPAGYKVGQHRRHTTCKTCTVSKVKEWRLANPEKYREQLARNHARVRNDPKRRARERQLENVRRRSKTRRGELVQAACKRCGENFEYEFIQRGRDLCDLCRRYASDWKKFGFTGPEAAKFRSSAKCDICGREKDPGGRFNNWHIDHEHGTKKVRGLLCAYCNTVLGLMNHDPARLRAAADYLEA